MKQNEGAEHQREGPVDDSDQHIGSQGETHGEKRNKGCSLYQFFEFKSLESSDSVQRNEWDQGDPERQPDSRWKCVAATLAHQSTLIAFQLFPV